MSDLDQLDNRIKSAFAGTKQRIEEIQRAAGQSYDEMHRRYEQFEELLGRIGPEIVEPRLNKLVEFFPHVEATPTVSRQGREVRLKFPKTPECPVGAQVKLAIVHDAGIHNLILEYNVEILPIFADYERSARFTKPLAEVDEQAVAEWIDDRLVKLAETLLSLQFVDEYQRDLMVVDPVAETRFPKNFAKGSMEHGSQVYYFLAEQTLEEFKKNPDEYVGGGRPASTK
ncbi:MAG: hypothetical protein H8E44_44095 [Planctomycetes bacterium]|nr:hypothetical protein [Planctomycetota bacterium]